MKEMKLTIKTHLDMIELGKKIGSIAFPNMIICMNGDLGSGKTTMTKGIGIALNIKDVINSPTFTIMKIYHGTLDLYHLDVYRITNENDDFELEEYFYLGGVSVIEWSDQIKGLLHDVTCNIDISINDLGYRDVVITGIDSFISMLEAMYE